MRILLDTHMLLWWLGDDPSLPPLARAEVANPENSIFVSAVSFWEIWLKISIGKLSVAADFERALAQESFENLPLTAAQTKQVAQLPWHHRDPFDRMLIAQAQVEGLVLLTSDRSLAPYGDSVRVVST